MKEPKGCEIPSLRKDTVNVEHLPCITGLLLFMPSWTGSVCVCVCVCMCVCVCNVCVLAHACVCVLAHSHACMCTSVCLTVDAINIMRGSACVWCGAEMWVFGCLALFVSLLPDEQIITITALCAR